jgi:AcrB/AcrD/AcrF family
MTSFAFIFGLFPLWNALGAGGQSRHLIGTVPITGMIFSSAFAIFLVLVLFVVVEWMSHRIRGKPFDSSAIQRPAPAQVRLLRKLDKEPLRSPRA